MCTDLSDPHAQPGSTCSGSTGTICTLHCAGGFYATATLSCGTDGVFSGGSCQPCAPITHCQVPACTADSDGSASPSTCTLCDRGYQNHDDPAVCVGVECQPLATPQNSTVSISPVSASGGIRYPSTATFSCFSRPAGSNTSAWFVLSDTHDTRTCQVDGNWNAPAPHCIETCAGAPCNHGAVCFESHDKHFSCTCPMDAQFTDKAIWAGQRCDQDVNGETTVLPFPAFPCMVSEMDRCCLQSAATRTLTARSVGQPMEAAMPSHNASTRPVAFTAKHASHR